MQFSGSTVRVYSRFSLLKLHRSSSYVATVILLLLAGLQAHAQNVTLSTTSLNFGNQAIGTTSKVKSVSMMNTGTATLSITSIVANGDFAQTNTCGSSLPPNKKCVISVTFTPTVIGVASGSVVITDNAPDSPQTVTLTGSGVQPVVLMPSSIQFPSRTVGTTSAAYNFTLKNNLTTAVTITSISISGDFAQTNACGSSLAAGAKCVISVTFTPTQTGIRTGTLSVYDSASNSPQTASLSGKGTTVGLVSIAVAPANPTIGVGSTLQFTATGTFNTGSSYDLTKSVVWSSSSKSVATIGNTSGSQGLATALADGTTNIKATAGTITGSTSLTVAATLVSISVTPAGASIAAGQTQQFTATGTYSDGSTKDLTSSATWSSAVQNVATVNSTGLATGVSVGSTNITASSGSISGFTSLTVTAPALVSISVSPGSASIPVGNTQQFAATGTYSDGSTKDLTSSANWSSSALNVATISSAGLATGVSVGSTTITASSGNVSGCTLLTVTAPALLSISVSPDPVSISVGGTQQFTAIGTYTDGSTQDLTTTATWSSSDATVATVNSSGLASGVKAGSVTITALSSGITGTATLNVTAGTPNVWTQDPSPIGPPVRCFVTAPSGKVLACVPGIGVFVSSDGGSSWSKTASSGLVDVEVDALMFSGATLLAGTHDGVYVSSDEGASWTKSSSGLPPIYGSTATVYRFAAFGNTIYAGTESGLYISQNVGQNWTAAGKLPTQNVRGLAVDASGNIYVGLNDGGDGGALTQNGSLWISRDGGNTWSWGGFTAWSVRSICVTGQTIFAGSWRTPYATGGVEESYDGGATWTLALSGYSPNEIAMINGTLYVATRESQLFASSDNGKTFTQLATGSGAQFAIAAASAGLLLGSDGIYSSIDMGNSWSHQTLSSPSEVAQLLYATDGTIYARSMLFGISKSVDGGATWTYINNGAPVQQQRGIHANYMLFNAQGDLLHEIDNSLYRYQNGVWTKAKLNSNTYINGIILLPNGDILVGDASNCVYRSTDGGSNFGTCTHINTGTGGGVIFEFSLDSNQTLYAAEDGTGAWESTDLGYTWNFIGAGPTLAMGNMYSIVPFDSTVFAAKAGSGKGVVFRYLGSSNWVRSDTGIGSSVVYQLLVTPSGELLAIGDLEIDVSSDGQNWSKVSTGLPRLTNPYYDDVSSMQKAVAGPDGKVHVGISYGGYGTYSAMIQ